MIYLIEDDDSIRKLVSFMLSSQGFESKGFERPSDFWKETKKPDLILLDIMLPEEDGISVLKKLKSNDETKNIPIIMLTAKSTEFDKVSALDFGADDYISKPFGMMELMARIKAVLRRCGNINKNSSKSEYENEIQIENLLLNKASHRLFIVENGNQKEIFLTLKEFYLLQKLLENRGIVLTREQLLLSVWNLESNLETRTVDVHVRYLRSKLGKAGDLIQTIRGVGYCIR